jgi:hypothetical protein
MQHSKTNPSINYLEHIEYYKQMHKEGINLINGGEEIVKIAIMEKQLLNMPILLKK